VNSQDTTIPRSRAYWRSSFCCAGMEKPSFPVLSTKRGR